LNRRKREREGEGAAFSSLPFWMYVREKKKRRRKSSSINHRPVACSSTTHCYRSLVVVKLKQAGKRKRENYMSIDIQLYSFLFLIIIIIFLAIDDGEDLDINYLTGIYERIRADEFRPDNDHVTQVAQFEQILVGKKPTLTAPHRRLVCYCRLYEIYDIIKREKLTAHQREVYLFNDLLIVS